MLVQWSCVGGLQASGTHDNVPLRARKRQAHACARAHAHLDPTHIVARLWEEPCGAPSGRGTTKRVVVRQKTWGDVYTHGIIVKPDPAHAHWQDGRAGRADDTVIEGSGKFLSGRGARDEEVHDVSQARRMRTVRRG